jgi:hypothetical protein
MMISNYMSRSSVRTILILIVLVMIIAAPAVASACGMPLEARIPSEQALIVFADGRQEIITSVQLESESDRAAVVFPVPGVPEVSVLESDEIFTYLDRVTRPLLRTEEQLVWSDADRATGGAPTGGVQVLGREVIGGYDVARLAADDPGALQRWLDENGYAAPAEAEPILRAYIEEQWKFVAVKLAPGQEANGILKPLQLAFDSDQIVYPMRLDALADHPIDMLIYVLADHRVEIAGMETQYAGPVAQLDEPPPAGLAPVFRAPYLTKMRNFNLAPASLTSDFVALQAPDDQPFRQEQVRIVYVDGWRRMFMPIMGMVLAITLSAVALGIAIGIRRRINAIAGPEPERDDD